jgi:hypothetical protein
VPTTYADGLCGYQVPVFTGKESNRNHYDNRDVFVESLVMHYTVCPYEKALNLFTENKPDGRVSSTYVLITQAEENGVPGGMIVQRLLLKTNAHGMLE